MHQMLLNFVRCARLGGLTLDEILGAVRKQFLIDALNDNKANQLKTAKVIGMHRNTLRRAIDEHDINVRGMQKEFREKKKAAASVGASVDVTRRA